MSAIFESILHMSAVGSIVIFTVVIVRFFLKNAPKVYTYILWAIVLVRLLCPFTIESPMSTIPNDLVSDQTIEHWEQTYTGEVIRYEDSTPQYQEAVNAGVEPIYTETGGSYVDVAPDGLTPAPTVKTDWMPILGALWLCGVAVMALWGCWGYIRLKMRLCEAMVCEKNVYLSCKVDTPFVLGLFRPKIYLPASLSPEEWDYIVLHERYHIRRGDHITRVLAFAALAIHWFNPLVWLAFILSGRDMELSCDEAVLRSMGAEVRQAYSASLLRLATGRSPLSAMPLAFGEGDPKERIRNLAKWRKPTRAMIIAALIVCIVAAVCLLTDPVERDAQIKVNGRVYTYTGDNENPTDIIWELGTLEGIFHRSDEEPTDDFHGTNLDEKYAGQPLYACLDGRIYLFDENGYYLPFELPKGDIVSGPIEVARGDFDRDGQGDFITVTEYPDSVEIVLADSLSAKTLWKDTASLVEGQQKCFTARKDEEGDSIIRYTFHEEGYCNYIRFFIGGDGELVVETGRSPISEELQAYFMYPEAISASLPENSTFLLSTYGGNAMIGPIKRAGSDKPAEPMETADSIESAVEGFLDAYLSIVYLYIDEDFTKYTVAAAEGLNPEDSFSFNGKTRTLEELADNVRYLEEKAEYWKNARQGQGIYRTNLSTNYYYEVCEDNGDWAFVRVSAMSSFTYRDQSTPSGIQNVFEIELVKINSTWHVADVLELYDSYDAQNKPSSSDEDSPPEDTIIDDGSSYPLAVPYGVSVVTDLDGDGVTETICQKVNESGYRIESITVNGVEYLDEVLELCLPYPNNAEAHSIPCWYITDILSGDGKKEMTFYDGGPSADPVTFFFDYDKGELKYLGNVPYYSDYISYGGDGYFTSPARLAVFQTWFTEHTWSIFGPGGTVQNEPRDFYYVDFRFRDYTIGDEYFPGSDTSPLLREVKVYDKMDINSELRLLTTGMEISILGTDNVEWLLISDGSREYYLHINGAAIEAPGGNYLEAQKVLNGLHYYG